MNREISAKPLVAWTVAAVAMASAAVSVSCDSEEDGQPTDVLAPTETPAPPPSITPMPAPTLTPTPTRTATPLPTPSPTPVPAPKNTPIPTATPTPEPPQSAQVVVPTDTPVPSPTPTSVPTPTNTPVPTPTDTPVPQPTPTTAPAPEDTPTPTATFTPVPTDTPSPIPTDTPAPEPTNTLEPTVEAATPVPTVTPVPIPTEAPTATSEADPTPTIAVPTPATASARDRAALIDLYDATNGRNWVRQGNWQTDGPLQGWEGIELNADGRVVQLELYENGLSGVLPSSMGDLSELAVLMLKGNDLTGDLPASLGNLRNLEVMWISGNSFTGCIPDALMYVVNNDFEFAGIPFCGVDSLPGGTLEPTATQEPQPTVTVVLEPEDKPTPTPVVQATATPIPDPAALINAAFSRLNKGRQDRSLTAFENVVTKDDSYIPVHDILIGCLESLDEHPELQEPDLDGIEIKISTAGTECGLSVVTYHIVPRAQRMRVEKRIWDCFTEHRDIREASDISCGGRFTFLGRHVKWLPKQVYYSIVDGDSFKPKFQALIPWIEEKLKTKVYEASSTAQANIFLHLGVSSPAGCPERYGCSIAGEDEEGKQFATIYVIDNETYFDQVLKHELLHALLPMGHLPHGNYLMSVRPDDPSQTQTLTSDELKLLDLYTHRYLRNNMTMDQFKRYLVVE